ncbi:MAG: ABC transporter substrate-binding protein [Chloroflexi bacterium]|nr:ABC transporter substrate-binding protein [Chloroflexota bacterium]
MSNLRWQHLLASAALTLPVLLAACRPAAPAPATGGNTSAVNAPTASTTSAAPASYDHVDNAIATDRTGKGGTLIVGMSAGNIPYPNTPPNEGYEGTRFVGNQIYDELTPVNYDQGDSVPVPGPGLATDWAVGDDKLTWTFHLRQGVKFHDGTEFNADAVVFNFDRLLNKDFPYFDATAAASNGFNLLKVDTYRAVDPYTLEIKTKSPYSFLPWDMSHMMIASPTAVKTYGVEEYIKHATGTGPFKMTKYIDGQVMELDPNENYWGGKPKLDKLILRPMPDPATRLAALQSGEINWAEVPPPDSVDQLSKQGFNVILKQYPHTIIFALNTYDKPFSDIRVRQALQYAIDREGMCTALLRGLCMPASQYLYPGHPWFDPQLGTTFHLDVNKAKQLLADAGYPNGFKMSIAYPTGGSGNMWPGPMMELVQTNFKAVGIDLQLVPLEWNNIITLFIGGFSDPANKKYDAVYISLAPDAPPFTFQSFTSDGLPPNGCCNATGYVNPKVDELVHQAQNEFDAQKQDALLQQAQGILASDSSFTFAVHDLNLRVLSQKVRGFMPSRSWFADLRNVWVKP